MGNTRPIIFSTRKTINELLVQHGGHFVANPKEETQEAMQEYGKTQFGGWPYNSNESVHDKKMGRFANFTNGEKK